MKFLFFLSTFLVISTVSIAQQARLTVRNESQREMRIKIMEAGGGLHSTMNIGAYSEATEYFAENGSFYLKTKAVLNGKQPLYKKGKAFQVYNGSDGYSVLTITYSITESNAYNPTEGKLISKSEFDRDDR